jgi:hypothetical protein
LLLPANPIQPILQRRAARLDEKSEKVKVEAVMERVQLQTGDEFYGKFPGNTKSFLHIVHGVVVREGDGPKAFVAGHLEDLPGRMLSIRGSVGVNVQVNHRMILVENTEKIYFNPHPLPSPAGKVGIFFLQILVHPSPKVKSPFRAFSGLFFS